MNKEQILQNLDKGNNLLIDIKHNIDWRMNATKKIIKRDIDTLKGILDEVELLINPKLIDDIPPQLNKHDCYTPLPDIKPVAGCRICGGTMVLIRGKYPNDNKREICPTCAQERLDQIAEISQPDYGMAYKSNGV